MDAPAGAPFDGWIDKPVSRSKRERSAAAAVPGLLPLLDPAQIELLRRWVRSDGLKRGRTALLKEAGPSGIERAEALCEQLLQQGWIVRQERLLGGHWQWESLLWRDLPRLQALLEVAGPAQRSASRQAQLDEARAWLEARRASAATRMPDPDLLDELAGALQKLEADKSLRPELLAARLGLLTALADWQDADSQGSRRDFALRSRGTTKALTEADWRWLETSFDLERLRIARFAPMAWLAGDVVLRWGQAQQAQQVQLGLLHCLGIPLADLLRTDAAAGPARWWLIENRASFERQALQREAGLGLLWVPGRPSHAWLKAVTHLVALAPAPAWISGDLDPAGVDIACTVGALWSAQGLAWEPHQMGVAELEATLQHWPLNAHDHGLLALLERRPDLPASLRALCEAMRREGRKAEQEGWL